MMNIDFEIARHSGESTDRRQFAPRARGRMCALPTKRYSIYAAERRRRREGLEISRAKGRIQAEPRSAAVSETSRSHCGNPGALNFAGLHPSGGATLRGASDLFFVAEGQRSEVRHSLTPPLMAKQSCADLLRLVLRTQSRSVKMPARAEFDLARELFHPRPHGQHFWPAIPHHDVGRIPRQGCGRRRGWLSAASQALRGGHPAGP